VQNGTQRPERHNSCKIILAILLPPVGTSSPVSAMADLTGVAQASSWSGKPALGCLHAQNSGPSQWLRR
jgi:hypothetical protein